MPKKAVKKHEEKSEKDAPKKATEAEFESKVVELGKKGITSEKIGETLKKENVHPKEYSKKISDILKTHNLYKNPDLKNIEEKLLNLRSHYEKNKQDKRAMRERERLASQIRKLKFSLKIA
jgi:ribosomal protein S15P/S13E